jgi:hypothetical protein
VEDITWQQTGGNIWVLWSLSSYKPPEFNHENPNIMTLSNPNPLSWSQLSKPQLDEVPTLFIAYSED